MPAPSHTWQMCGLVPGFPPVPEQVAHGDPEVNRRLIVTPSIASTKLIVALLSTSGPRWGRGPRRPPCRVPPKRSPHMSPQPPPPAARSRSRSLLSNPPPPPPPTPPPTPPLGAPRVASYSGRFSASPPPS